MSRPVCVCVRHAAAGPEAGARDIPAGTRLLDGEIRVPTEDCHPATQSPARPQIQGTYYTIR